jgi:excinuclease ABC subunit C
VFEHHEKAKRACLLGEAGVCSAPCISPEGYEERVKDARRVLEGETKAVSVNLSKSMESLASERRYEAAAKVRDALQALKELGDSGVAAHVSGYVAAVACASDDIGSCVQILVVRDGIIVSSPTVLLDNAMFSTGTIAHDVAIPAVLLSTFSKASPPPPMLLLETPLSVEVTESLSTLSTRKVRSKKPTKGPSRELLDLAQRNAAHALSRARTRRAQDADSRRNELVVLADVLGLSAPPLKIECVDISHIGGLDTTAAFAVLEDGLAHRSRHRSFNLDTGNDDPASIYQAVQKRIAAAVKQRTLPAAARDKSLAYLPQLLVVDGGPTQLAAAVRAIEESGETLAAVSLAKRLEEVFLPGSTLPMRLALDSPALYVLQRARDAAHDWSLRCSKRKRSKRTALTGLEGVPGLGPKRLAQLLSSVSLSDLKGMTPEEMPVFLPVQVRLAIHQHLASV